MHDFQAERNRSEDRLTSQLQQKDTEIQQQVAELQLTRTQLQEKDVQIHQREAELRQARVQLQQKDVELSSIQRSCEVLRGYFQTIFFKISIMTLILSVMTKVADSHTCT